MCHHAPFYFDFVFFFCISDPKNDSICDVMKLEIMMIRFFCFQEKSVKDIVLKAMGQAISKTVAISEILKVSVFLLMNFVKYL